MYGWWTVMAGEEGTEAAAATAAGGLMTLGEALALAESQTPLFIGGETGNDIADKLSADRGVDGTSTDILDDNMLD
jgi:hypothetical protein